jgi:hypothetical protein
VNRREEFMNIETETISIDKTIKHENIIIDIKVIRILTHLITLFLPKQENKIELKNSINRHTLDLKITVLSWK